MVTLDTIDRLKGNIYAQKESMNMQKGNMFMCFIDNKCLFLWMNLTVILHVLYFFPTISQQHGPQV